MSCHFMEKQKRQAKDLAVVSTMEAELKVLQGLITACH